jgi:hypothetical protein
MTVGLPAGFAGLALWRLDEAPTVSRVGEATHQESGCSRWGSAASTGTGDLRDLLRLRGAVAVAGLDNTSTPVTLDQRQPARNRTGRPRRNLERHFADLSLEGPLGRLDLGMVTAMRAWRRLVVPSRSRTLHSAKVAIGSCGCSGHRAASGRRQRTTTALAHHGRTTGYWLRNALCAREERRVA